MTTLRLNLEAKLGVSIYQIMTDLVEAANCTNLECSTRVNGCLFIARPGTCVDRLTEAYHDTVTREGLRPGETIIVQCRT